tara:strand:+ start:323 stop:1012 length:690 start_codon:yes stop_codon:yes gene_type:complete
VIKIEKKDICNLSRIPVAMENNPCYATARQIIEAEGNFSASLYRETSLYKHYKAYNPQTIYDFYGVTDKLKGHSATCSFLPWIYEKPMKDMIDVAFINFLTEEFVYNQVKKIKELIASFSKHGYVPSMFPDRKGGNVTGYFLKNKDKSRFYIVSGNHRASVFFALYPERSFPVIYEDPKFAKPRELIGRTRSGFHQVYDFETASDWPSVKSGFLTTQEALNIAEVYLNV